jgi:hypothetical protein
MEWHIETITKRAADTMEWHSLRLARDCRRATVNTKVLTTKEERILPE